MELRKNEFIERIEDYTSSCDYEGLHYYMEVNPDILANQYPVYQRYLSQGRDSDTAIRLIADYDLAWTYE